MAELKYITGCATEPKGNGRKIIAHICNDIGEWGEGFLLTLSQKWVQPEMAYRQWHAKGFYKENRRRIPFALGKIQLIPCVKYDISVVNMIGLQGIWQTGAEAPIRYKAIQECFRQLIPHALENNSSVHLPRIDEKTTGGEWEIIEELIIHELIEEGINVFVYDLP